MKPQVGILLKPKTFKDIKDYAEQESTCPASIGRKCIEIALPLLMAGIPTSALVAMAGKRGRR